MKFKLTAAAMLCAYMAAVSCGDRIEQPDTDKKEDGTLSAVVAGGHTQTVKIYADEKWTVENPCKDWVHVSPMSGLAGENTLTFTFGENRTMAERRGTVTVIDGARKHVFSFSQPCMDIMEFESTIYSISNNGGALDVSVKSSKSFSVSTDASWIHCPDTRSYSAGSWTMTFTCDANENPDARSAKIFISAENGKSASATVKQEGADGVDWTSSFKKMNMGYRFTGDWCGYCPYLAHALQSYESSNPGRLNYICFYDSSSNAKLKFSGTNKYIQRFGVEGFPSIVIDERGLASGLNNAGYLNVIKGMCDEGESLYPAVTGIAASVSVSGGKVDVSGSIYAKEAGDYRLHVVILENGVVQRQSDYTGLYSSAQLSSWSHNNVVRECVTAMLDGETIKSAARKKNDFSYSASIPSNVLDSNNISVAVYVERKVQSGPQKVQNVSYYNKFDWFIDNSVIVAAGESVDLKYE